MRILLKQDVTSTHITSLHDSSFNSLNSLQLMKIKRKAIRLGVWFRALPRIDRVLVDLTIKVAKNIRSPNLAKSLFEVVSKLEEVLQSSILKSFRLIGRPLAEKLSEIAQSLGNHSAKKWASDSSFALFLAIIHTNR